LRPGSAEERSGDGVEQAKRPVGDGPEGDVAGEPARVGLPRKCARPGSQAECGDQPLVEHRPEDGAEAESRRPADRVPACGPDLAYMIKRFPLSDMVSKVLMGSGQCAEVGWKMLGLSIAEWSLVWLVVLGLFALYLALRKQD